MTGERRAADTRERQPHFALISGDFSNADIQRGAKLGCTLFTRPLDFTKSPNGLTLQRR